MKVLLVEPFFEGSHRSWAEGLQKHSRHEIRLLSLPGRHWKWRMHGGAVSLAEAFLRSDDQPDLVLATDMLDVGVFLGLCRKRLGHTPVAVYFHENQLAYPWSPGDPDPALQRDRHYAFINFTTALAADAVLFNSAYNRDSFLEALPGFLKAFPDHTSVHRVAEVKAKSRVVPLGLELKRFDRFAPGAGASKQGPPLVLWNHRWEFDKNPEGFFEVLMRLAAQGLQFELAVVGKAYSRRPPVFDLAKEQLGDRIVRFGEVDSFEAYASWLWRADLLPVTSRQDFFGISVVEAMYCNVFPLLPRRLAYPGHIPEKHQARCFYTEPEDLEKMLVSCLTSGIPDLPVQSWVSGYDWGEQAVLFDRVVEGLMH